MLDSKAIDRIITHMNEDHADAVLLYARAFAARLDATSAQLIGFDETGMDIDCIENGQSSRCRVDFNQPLNNAGEARQVLVEMVGIAREKLAS